MAEDRQEFWNKSLQEGATLSGKVVDIRSAHSSFGDFVVIEVETPEGLRESVGAYSATLRSGLAETKIGDVLTITYNGKRLGKSGRQYHDFAVS